MIFATYKGRKGVNDIRDAVLVQQSENYSMPQKVTNSGQGWCTNLGNLGCLPSDK